MTVETIVGMVYRKDGILEPREGGVAKRQGVYRLY